MRIEPLRADARRNRDQILAAAKALFAEQGPDVPMEEFARRAGVGVGTLYRRFPDRDTLIRAVALDTFGRGYEDAVATVASGVSAWEALTRVVRASVETRASIRLGMLVARLRHLVESDEEVRRLHHAMFELIDGLVRAAQADGDMRADVSTTDVVLMWSRLCDGVSGHLSEELAAGLIRRCLMLMLDGLRAGHPGALPGRPISTDDLDLPWRPARPPGDDPR